MRFPHNLNGLFGVKIKKPETEVSSLKDIKIFFNRFIARRSSFSLNVETIKQG